MSSDTVRCVFELQSLTVKMLKEWDNTMVRGLTVLCSIGGLSCFNLDTVGEHVSDGGLFNTAGSFGTEIEFHKVSEEKM